MSYPIPLHVKDLITSTYNIKQPHIKPFIQNDYSVHKFHIAPIKKFVLPESFRQHHVHLKEQYNFSKFRQVHANNKFDEQKLQGLLAEIPKPIQAQNEINQNYYEFGLKGVTTGDYIQKQLIDEANTDNFLESSPITFTGNSDYQEGLNKLLEQIDKEDTDTQKFSKSLRNTKNTTVGNVFKRKSKGSVVKPVEMTDDVDDKHIEDMVKGISSSLDLDDEEINMKPTFSKKVNVAEAKEEEEKNDDADDKTDAQTTTEIEGYMNDPKKYKEELNKTISETLNKGKEIIFDVLEKMNKKDLDVKLKKLSAEIVKEILEKTGVTTTETQKIKKDDAIKMIITFLDTRAKNDEAYQKSGFIKISNVDEV